jgi:protein-S-isoprenylcysteine O-methyltransferase Ste14
MNQLVPNNIQPLRRKLYNLVAAAPLIALYLFSLTQMLSPLALQISQAKLLIQTDPTGLPPVLVLGIVSNICTMVFFAVMVVMFAVRRVPLHYPIAFYPRFVAGAGTFLGIGIVTLPPEELSSGLYLISLLSIIGGTVFAVWATLTLARSISIMPEARGLVTSGPYAFVRHPLYIGEFVVLFGNALQHSMPWALLLLGVQCVFQFERMKNEERVLARAFPDHADYMARTARLLPGVY